MKPEKLKEEYERLETMSVYEKEYLRCGNVCGVDEVGRGPLAGPVVAACVILKPEDKFIYLNDSKKDSTDNYSERDSTTVLESVW